MNEVVKVLIDKRPFLVVLAELLPVILQKVGLVLVLVEKVVPFVHDGFKPPASDGFCLFRHDGIEVPFTLVLRVGIDVNIQSLMTDGLHRFLVTVARIVIKVERQHTLLQWACSQCYCFAF